MERNSGIALQGFILLDILGISMNQYGENIYTVYIGMSAMSKNGIAEKKMEINDGISWNNMIHVNYNIYIYTHT